MPTTSLFVFLVRGPHQTGVEFQLVRIESQPVAVVMARERAAARVFREVGEPLLERAFGVLDARAPRRRGVAAGHQGFGFEIEFAQELRLPAIPDARADGADVGRGEDQQHPQAFGRLHHMDEVLDGLRIGDIAFLGRVAHHQMMANEPGHRRGIGGGKPEPRTNRFGEGRTHLGMVAGQALRHVVQQYGDIERLARLHPLDEIAHQGKLLPQFAAFHSRNVPDRKQQMLVHRVMVIHVELHQRDDAAEFRHEAAHDAGFVHAPERAFGIAARTEDVEKQPVGLFVIAQIVVDQIELARHAAQCRRVDVQALRIGDMEEPDEVDRVFAEQAGARGKPPVLDEEIIRRRTQFEETGQKPRQRRMALAVLFLERRAEDAGEVADVLRHQEVAPHEAFDGPMKIGIGVAQPLGELRLHIEGKPFFGPAGEIVQMTAHRPQEGFRLLEGLEFVFGEDAVMDEIARIFHAIKIFADPIERLQIAQPAFAVLDIGLDQIAAFALALMAFVALGELGFDEILAVAGRDVAPEFLAQFIVKLAVAPTESALPKARYGS